MSHERVLVVCRDAHGLESIRPRWQPGAEASGYEVVDLNDLVEGVGDGRRAVVVYIEDGSSGLADLDRALWACSTAPRSVPVVALVDRYDEEQARTCFQMGVIDYLSLRDHADRIGGLVASLVSGAAVACRFETGESTERDDGAAAVEAPGRNQGVAQVVV